MHVSTNHLHFMQHQLNQQLKCNIGRVGKLLGNIFTNFMSVYNPKNRKLLSAENRKLLSVSGRYLASELNNY